MKRTSAVAVLLSVLALLLGAVLVNSAAAAPSDSLTGDAGTFSYDNAPNIASASVESLDPPVAVVLPDATAAETDETGASPLQQLFDFVASTAALEDVSNYGGEFLDDALRSPVVRPDLGNLSTKIQRQMSTTTGFYGSLVRNMNCLMQANHHSRQGFSRIF